MPRDLNTLMDEIDKWSETYQFSFQFWGTGNNNVFIEKHGVDLYSSGGFNNIFDCVVDALQYIYRINRTIKHKRKC